MRSMMTGLTAWVRMDQDRTEAIRTVDTGITVVGTLLLAVTWVLFHSAR